MYRSVAPAVPETVQYTAIGRLTPDDYGKNDGKHRVQMPLGIHVRNAVD